MHREIQKAFGRLGKSIEAEIVKEVPKVTGNLADSVDVGRPDFKGNAAEFPINMVEYGIWLNEGTGLFGKNKRAYEILPKNKGALSFMIGDRKIITKKVIHPGIKPRRFVEKAVNRVMNSGEAEQEIGIALRKILNGSGRR